MVCCRCDDKHFTGIQRLFLAGATVAFFTFSLLLLLVICYLQSNYIAMYAEFRGATLPALTQWTLSRAWSIGFPLFFAGGLLAVQLSNISIRGKARVAVAMGILCFAVCVLTAYGYYAPIFDLTDFG